MMKLLLSRWSCFRSTRALRADFIYRLYVFCLLSSVLSIFLLCSAQPQASRTCTPDLFSGIPDLNEKNTEGFVELLPANYREGQSIVDAFFKNGYVALNDYDRPQFNYTPDKLRALAGSHVPVLYQIGHDTFELVNAHVQLSSHHSISWFVLDEDTGNAVAVFNTTRNFQQQPSYAVASLIFTIPESNSDIKELTPYMDCNLHGRWQGVGIARVDPVRWNKTLALGVQGPHEVCIRNKTSSNDQDVINFGLQPIVEGIQCPERYTQIFPTGQRVVIYFLDQEDTLGIEMYFSVDSYLAVGFTDSNLNPQNNMFPASMLICTALETDGIRVICEDYRTIEFSSRETGPARDSVQRLQIQSWKKTGNEIFVELRKSLQSFSESNNVRINVENQNLIFAQGDISGNGGLRYHTTLGRFQVMNANIMRGGTFLADDENAQMIREQQVVHGMLMFVFWGVNIALGACVARYYKDTQHWFQIHKFFQLVNTFLTIPIFLLTLGFVPKERRFETWHGKFGYVIVLLSLIQSCLGQLSHTLNKISKRLFIATEQCSHLHPDIRAAIEPYIPLKENLVKKRRDFFGNWNKRLKSLSLERQGELNEFVRKEINDYASPFSHIQCISRLTFFFVRTLNQTAMRKIHRVLGRCFLVIAYTQIILGLMLLRIGTRVDVIIYSWMVLLVLWIVYKEIERYFMLPKGIPDKIRGLKNYQRRKSLKFTSSSNSETSTFNDRRRSLPRANSQPARRSMYDSDGDKLSDAIVFRSNSAEYWNNGTSSIIGPDRKHDDDDAEIEILNTDKQKRISESENRIANE